MEQTVDNQTVLDIAEHMDRHDIVQTLKNHIKQVSKDMPDDVMPKRRKLDEPHQSSSVEQKHKHVSSSQSSPQERKLHSTDVEGNAQNAGSNVEDSKDKSYRKGGLVKNLHGSIYQLKLLMLFLKRALDKDYDFQLGTEVEDAGKFDDIVFKYKRKDDIEGDKICFLQAKHKQCEAKKITAQDLLVEKDGDFSLQKYFISYHKIVKNPAFSNCKLQDFILCTNINFDFSTLEDAGIKIEEIREKHCILDVTELGKSAVCYKLIVHDKNHKLYEILRKTSDLHLLVNELKDHICNNKTVQLKSDIFKLYHGPLTTEIFDVETRKYAKFRDNFLEGENLSEEAKRLRTLLRLSLGKTESNFQEYLKDKELTVSSDFGEIFDLQRNPNITDPKEFAKIIADIISKAQNNIIRITRTKLGIMKGNIDKLAGHVLVQEEGESKNLIRFRQMFFDNNKKLAGNLGDFRAALKEELQSKDINFSKLEQYKCKISNFKTCKETPEGTLLYSALKLPDGNIEDGTIDRFLESLLFALNLPNEVDLGKIIAKELGENSQFNLLNSDLVTESFEKQMLDWFKNEGGGFLDGNDGEKFFESIERKVSSLITVGFSLPYPEKLQAYGMKFEKNYIVDQLRTFLSNENTSRNVLHLVTAEETLLCALNVYDALELLKKQKEFEQYKRRDSYIFVRLSMLLRQETRGHLEDVFKSKVVSHNLLIVDCKAAAPEDMQSLYETMSVILSQTNKKIILIAKEHNMPVDRFPKSLKCDVIDNISFDDLTKESKERLLEKTVTFLGEKISLNKLIDISAKDVKYVIGAETLVQLITDQKIKIGSKPPGTSDMERAFSELFEEVNTEAFIDKLLDKSNDIYVISGIPDSSEKHTFIKYLNTYIEESKIDSIESRVEVLNRQYITRVINKEIQVTDNQFEEGHFRHVCRSNSEKTIYWITLQNEDNVHNFKLAQIYKPDYYVGGKRFNDVVITKDVITYLTSIPLSEIFIFVGKDRTQVESWVQFNDSQLKEFERNCDNDKIKFKTDQNDGEATFQESINADQARTVHLLNFEQDQLVWCKTHGSLVNLMKCRANDNTSAKSLIGEDDLIEKIIDRKVVIIAGEPGMGKSTTLTKLYESEHSLSSSKVSINKSHWVIRINLRDHLTAIRDIDFSNDDLETDKIKDFFSQVDENVSGDFARGLLGKALQMKNFAKPLLIAFDGFDEILDQADRDRIVSLLERLKNKTEAKFWITTRLHYKETLEDKLSSFAIKLESMSKDTSSELVEEYLRNRLTLILSVQEFAKLFDKTGKKTERMQSYIKAFLDKMQEVFKPDVSQFIGTPLQIYLMLEGFAKHFKKWMKDDNDFSYIGNDIWDVYEKFIERKYNTYFQKMAIREKLRQKHDQAMYDVYHRDLAKTLILKLPVKSFLKEFKDIYLSPGIVRSDGVNIQFIHPTFGEYFAAEVVMRWISKWKVEGGHRLMNLAKQKFLLRDVLLKPEYKVIRAFLNVKLLKEEIVYVKLQKEYHDGCIFTVAAEENNVGIAKFMLYNLRATRTEQCNMDNAMCFSLENSHVFSCSLYKYLCMSPLTAAAHFGSFEMVKFLVDEGENVDSSFFGSPVLCIAARRYNYDIVKFLVEKNADVNKREVWGSTVLEILVLQGNLEMVTFLVENGAHVDVRHPDCQTLDIATESGHLETFRESLLEKGVIFHALDLARSIACDIVGKGLIMRKLIDNPECADYDSVNED